MEEIKAYLQGRAVAACIFVLIVGISLSVYLDKPAWLARSGALVIIIGVLLGATRLPDLMMDRLTSNLHLIPSSLEYAKADFEKKNGRPMNKDEWNISEERALRLIKEKAVEGVKAWGIRFRKYEVRMLVGGTFINGFGEYLYAVIKYGNLNN